LARENNEWQPEKVIIHAGPSFGAAVGFMVLGAALGVTGAMLMLRNGEASARAEANRSIGEAEHGAARLKTRLNALSGRVKTLAARARTSAQHIGETVGPALKEAVQEGRLAARETEEELIEEIHSDEDDDETRPS
jgi:hypothetical protein